jgi:predicted RNA binding protein YcfA (HicA-like mRNA interferase family)
MARMPTLRGDEVVRLLRKAGFEVVRIKGSHHVLEHPDDPARRTVVAVHAGKDIKRGLLHKILNDVGLSAEEFLQLM